LFFQFRIFLDSKITPVQFTKDIANFVLNPDSKKTSPIVNALDQCSTSPLKQHCSQLALFYDLARYLKHTGDRLAQKIPAFQWESLSSLSSIKKAAHAKPLNVNLNKYLQELKSRYWSPSLDETFKVLSSQILSNKAINPSSLLYQLASYKSRNVIDNLLLFGMYLEYAASTSLKHSSQQESTSRKGESSRRRQLVPLKARNLKGEFEKGLVGRKKSILSLHRRSYAVVARVELALGVTLALSGIFLFGVQTALLAEGNGHVELDRAALVLLPVGSGLILDRIPTNGPLTLRGAIALYRYINNHLWTPLSVDAPSPPTDIEMGELPDPAVAASAPEANGERFGSFLISCLYLLPHRLINEQ